MSNDFIHDAAAKLFANEVDKKRIEAVEQGQFDEALWEQVNELGFCNLFQPESEGGIDASWSDAYPVFYLMGYHQVPLPLAETAMARLVLAAASRAVNTTRPIAVHQMCAKTPLSLKERSGVYTLHGALDYVKWARHCSHLLLEFGDGRLALIDLRAKGCEVLAESDISGMPADHVRLDGAAVLDLFDNPFPDLSEPLKTLGAGARSMMMVGALEFALDQSVQYAKDRVQFGKPIGKNQAIQQQLALMAGEVAVARAAAVMAAKDMPDATRRQSPSALFSVASAKVCAGDAVTSGTSIAHQVHGAIGFTYEHPLNFATRRLWAWRGDFGTSAHWARRLGQGFVAQGGDKFWPALTARVLAA